MNKNLLLAGIALLAGSFAMSAQQQVVKDAERAQKSGAKGAEVVKIMTPAFSDAETATQSATYYIPGKAFFKEYDDMFGLKSLGRLEDKDRKHMCDVLIEGYNYYMKALPYDAVVDAKGKTKTKYTKDIINTVTGHSNDYNTSAIDYWELKDYEGAYKAWDIFLGMYENPEFNGKLAAQSDTVLGEVYFNQALAAWQADMLANALNSFKKAEGKGYHKKQLYDYALAVATNLKDNDAVAYWATQGNNLYGKEDSNYLGFIINGYLESKEYDKAFATIDEAIATDPTNAQYYVVKGILYDNQEKKPEAKAMFKKAVELDANNAQANQLYGIALCNDAYALNDQAPATAAEYQAYYNSKIKPLFEEAAEYLEKAWEIDNKNIDALRYLENVYYNLKLDDKQEEVRERIDNM